MKVLNVSEVTNGIDKIISKKQEEREDLQSISDAINKVVNLDNSLTGKGGEAIKENFILVHVPILISFETFIDSYIENLQQIKSLVESYESGNGFIREDFIEQDVSNGINKVEQMTHDFVDDINKHLNTVNDLMHTTSINLYQFNQTVSDSKQQMEKTLEGLRELDANSEESLKIAEDDLQKVHESTSKVVNISRKGALLSQTELQRLFKKY
ncbi:LXG domain-containing protein [Bacillus carboniphilus]|uniref:LXG domain-containing protein n=1 Tax=Bacillus carboniphilus TaxID=86663 RepID=A0ABY9JWY6_9BACI|nr:LXG domain-containing protein [Bacillus carboniphilus]WLR42813.1 LXG domain-containing protein [Bacillus carboniphilus]